VIWETVGRSVLDAWLDGSTLWLLVELTRHGYDPATGMHVYVFVLMLVARRLAEGRFPR
jgi:hypothetical protein